MVLSQKTNMGIQVSVASRVPRPDIEMGTRLIRLEIDIKSVIVIKLIDMPIAIAMRQHWMKNSM